MTLIELLAQGRLEGPGAASQAYRPHIGSAPRPVSVPPLPGQVPTRQVDVAAVPSQTPVSSSGVPFIFGPRS